MKHEPFSAPTTTQTPDRHRLNRDYETRSRLNLKKVGLARYAADPSTTIICMAYAVDDGPVQRWFPGDPVPPVWFEAAANPDEWVAIAHNDPFDSAIEQHVGPRYGFPPILHHRCTQAASLAAGLPAKLDLLANATGIHPSQGCRGRTADASDVEAAEGPQRRGSERRLLAR